MIKIIEVIDRDERNITYAGDFGKGNLENVHSTIEDYNVRVCVNKMIEKGHDEEDIYTLIQLVGEAVDRDTQDNEVE